MFWFTVWPNNNKQKPLKQQALSLTRDCKHDLLLILHACNVAWKHERTSDSFCSVPPWRECKQTRWPTADRRQTKTEKRLSLLRKRKWNLTVSMISYTNSTAGSSVHSGTNGPHLWTPPRRVKGRFSHQTTKKPTPHRRFCGTSD